ncbi:gap junction alpha-3 protein-like [Nematolebias whitei]|uniref:gap junction alpha-3 protein-like n=1 Tax=Nematolebias whitei TaxID=451745 RepID=UPI00189B39C9|nr:gap junction alpha-3 protein-like [Nematolebias whitei]
MGGLGYLVELLGKAQEHSTAVGKVWLTVLFIFRIMVLKSAVEDVWDNEESDFLCDTNQPGCEAICYDKTFPISHPCFWVMQIIFVSTPTLVYLGHKVHLLHMKRKKQHSASQDDREKQSLCNQTEEAPSMEKHDEELLKRKLFYTYTFNVIFKIIFEVVFIVGQYFLYGFRLKPMYTCNRWPCLTTVYCYISRPTEKTLFIVFMLIVACVSLLLNLVEVFYLFYKKNPSSVL